MLLLIPGQYILLFAPACIIDVPWWAECRLLSICFLNLCGMTIRLSNRTIWSFIVRYSLTFLYSWILGGVWCLVFGKPVLTVVARQGFPQVLPTWGGLCLKIYEGSLSQNMGRAWGELKMLSKNTCGGVHLIVKLLAISLQAFKFTKNELIPWPIKMT